MGNLYGGIATCPDPSWIREGDGFNGRNLDMDLYREAEDYIKELKEYDEDEADVLLMMLEGANCDDDIYDVIDRCNDALREVA
jgi:hypothetical protein